MRATKRAKQNKTTNVPSEADAKEALLRLLLEHFSVVDAIFTEADAFSHKNKSLGRIYRSWKQVRKVMDPDFKSKLYKRDRYEDRRG